MKKKYTLIAAGILLLAIAAGILVNTLTSRKKPEPTPSPTPTVIAVTPGTPTPTPTPTVTSLKLYSYGRELDDAGFTMYVGDRPVELNLVVEPDMEYTRAEWALSDPESAELDVSSDGKTCKINALKPSGKNELIVTCYGMYTSIPVYLWER